MEDSGGALDRNNDPGARPGVPNESLVHAGSHSNGRRDLVAEVLLVAQTPLVGGSPLSNPESPSGGIRSRGRGGDSPRSRVGAVAEVDVSPTRMVGRVAVVISVSWPTTAQSIVAVVVAWCVPTTRVLSTLSRVEVPVIIGITIGIRGLVGLTVLLICLRNRLGGRRYDRLYDRRRGRWRRAMSCGYVGSSL